MMQGYERGLWCRSDPLLSSPVANLTGAGLEAGYSCLEQLSKI